MSLSSALASAASGLVSTARSAQTVSNNVANALTPGYAAREVVLTSALLGGVVVADVTRRESLSLLTDRRMAEAGAAGEQARSQSLAKVTDLVGAANNPASLSGRVAAFASSLSEAASLPSSDQRLGKVLATAKGLVSHINRAGEGIQAERLAADRGIGEAVDTLTQSLARIDRLNREIVKQGALGQDVNSLKDERRLAVDAIAALVPVREFPRENGRIGLITETGQVLLIDSPAEITFSPAGAMTPDAALSGLTIDGRPVDTANPNGPVAGGQIAALFDLRDNQLPDAQAQIDAFAQELVTRFEGIGGAPGLFTGNGAAPEAGTAQWLMVNERVTEDGKLYRLRDGINADAPIAGGAGDARLLQAYIDAIDQAVVPSNSALGSTAQDIGTLADSVVGQAAAVAFRAETDVSFSESRLATLQEAELSQGVNTDEEMRKLLQIEQAYAANARVIQAAGAMLDRILEI